MGASPALPRSVRVGYGAGSVATGAFGTVPGLMLLPYLTDTLAIPALLAGVIVFGPKAWDVVLNPIAGRISDRTTDPRGARRPWLLRAGVALALCFALLFAAPDLDSRALDAAWVLVAFGACATAYAFFQVPYVAMPAEITDSYAERTRLMTWRVAILAFTILLAGASADGACRRVARAPRHQTGPHERSDEQRLVHERERLFRGAVALLDERLRVPEAEPAEVRDPRPDQRTRR